MKKNELILAHSLHIDIAKEIAKTIIDRQSLGDDDSALQQHPITVGELTSLIESQKPPTLNPSTLSRHIISAFNNKKNAYYKDLNRKKTRIRVIAADGSLFAHNILSNLEQAGMPISDSNITECIRLTLRNLEIALNQCYQEVLEVTSCYLDCEIQFETWSQFQKHIITPKDRNTTDFSYAGSKNLWSEGVLPLIKIVKESPNHVNTYDFLLQSMHQLHLKALLKEQQQQEEDTKLQSAQFAAASSMSVSPPTAPASNVPPLKKAQACSTSVNSQLSASAAANRPVSSTTRTAPKPTQDQSYTSSPSHPTAPPSTDTVIDAMTPSSNKNAPHAEQKQQEKRAATSSATASNTTSTSFSYSSKKITAAASKHNGPRLKSKRTFKPKGYDVFINRSILLNNLHLFSDHSINDISDQLKALLGLPPQDSSGDIELEGNTTMLKRFIERVYDNRKPLRFTVIELNAVDIKDPDEVGSLSSPLGRSTLKHPKDEIISSLKQEFTSILGGHHQSTINQCVQLILDRLPSPEVETQIGRIIRACYISAKSYSHRQQKGNAQNSFQQNICIKWAMRYIANEVDIYSSYFRLHSDDRDITYRPLANSVSTKLSPHDYAVVCTMEGWRNREHNTLTALSHLVCSPLFNIETTEVQKQYASPLFKGSTHALNRFITFLLQENNINAFFDKTIREWVETIFFNNTMIYSTPAAISLWSNILDNLYRACNEKSSSNGKLFLSLQAALFFQTEPSDTKVAAAAEKQSQQDVSSKASSTPLLAEKNSLTLNEERAKFLFFISMGKNPYNFIAPFLPPQLPTNSPSTTRLTDRSRPHSQPSLDSTPQVKLTSLFSRESKVQSKVSSHNPRTIHQVSAL